MSDLPVIVWVVRKDTQMDTLRYKQLDSLNLVEVKRELAFFLEHAQRVNWDVSDETIGYMNQLDSVIKALS